MYPTYARMSLGDHLPTDQEIRDICLRVTLADSTEQFKAALTELKIAIREHVADAHNRGIQMILEMPKRKPVLEQKDGTQD